METQKVNAEKIRAEKAKSFGWSSFEKRPETVTAESIEHFDGEKTELVRRNFPAIHLKRPQLKNKHGRFLDRSAPVQKGKTKRCHSPENLEEDQLWREKNSRILDSCPPEREKVLQRWHSPENQEEEQHPNKKYARIFDSCPPEQEKVLEQCHSPKNQKTEQQPQKKHAKLLEQEKVLEQFHSPKRREKEQRPQKKYAKVHEQEEIVEQCHSPELKEREEQRKKKKIAAKIHPNFKISYGHSCYLICPMERLVIEHSSTDPIILLPMSGLKTFWKNREMPNLKSMCLVLRCIDFPKYLRAVKKFLKKTSRNVKILVITLPEEDDQIDIDMISAKFQEISKRENTKIIPPNEMTTTLEEFKITGFETGQYSSEVILSVCHRKSPETKNLIWRPPIERNISSEINDIRDGIDLIEISD